MRIWKYAFGLLVFIAFICTLNAVSADTHTSQASGNAATAGTWDNGVPAAGDDLILTGAYNIGMNQVITYGTITLDASYSGTMTVAANFGCSGYTQAAGTAAGSTTNYITCSGSVSNTAGGIGSSLMFILTGDGSTFSFSAASGQTFRSIQVSANITLNSNIATITNQFLVDAGKTLTIAASKSIIMMPQTNAPLATPSFANSGIINGPGTVTLTAFDRAYNVNLGVMNCAVTITAESYVSASYILVATGSGTIGGSLTVNSGHATRTMSFDLKGYSFSETSLVIGARGIVSSSVAGSRIIDSGALTVSTNGRLDATNIPWISCGTTWDSSAGTYLPGTGQVNMTNNGTTKLSATQYFYSLTVASGKTRTLLSNVAIQNEKDMAGTLTEGAYSVTINGTSTTPARLNGTWDGVINITSTGGSYQIYAGASWTGTIQASKALTIIMPTGQLVITPPANKYFNVTLKGWTTPSTYKWYAGSTTSNANISFAATVANATREYVVYLDSAPNQYKISSAGKVVSFYYASWSGHWLQLKELALISGSPATTLVEDHNYYYNATADQTGTWSIVTTHAWMAVNGGTGKITGTPINNQVAVHTVVLKLTTTNGVAYKNWTLTVTNVAPVITSSPSSATNVTGSYSYNMASDEEGQGVTYHLATTTDSRLSINASTGVLSGNLDSMIPVDVTIYAADGNGGVTWQNFTINIPNMEAVSNIAPLLISICAIMIGVYVITFPLNYMNKKK
jgi:hypothetical protein